MKIKEVVEERRVLTDDEFWIFNSQGGVDYLEKNKGFVSIIAICGGQYTGVFKKEIIREPTFEEDYAIWVKQMLVKCPCYDGRCGSLPCHVCVFSCSAGCCLSKHGRIVDWANVILKDKEIIED